MSLSTNHGTGAERVVDVGVEIERREDEDPRVPAPGDPGRCGDPVHDRHRHVHEDHVGTQPPGEVAGLEPVLGLADYLEVGVVVDDRAQADADQCRESNSMSMLCVV